MPDDYSVQHDIAKTNVSSIVGVVTHRYADKFTEIEQLLSGYMEDNNLSPESTITCQDCINLCALADHTIYKNMINILTDILSQIYFELSYPDDPDD